MAMNPHFPISEDLGLQPAHKLMNRRIICVQKSTPISIAIKTMQIHKISGLAVVDGQRRLLGSYSEWDAMIQGATHSLDNPIKCVEPAISAPEDLPFRGIVAMMIKHRTSHILIELDKKQVIIKSPKSTARGPQKKDRRPTAEDQKQKTESKTKVKKIATAKRGK